MEKTLIGGYGIVQENEPGVPAQLMMKRRKTEFVRAVNAHATDFGSRPRPVAPQRLRTGASSARHAAAYFGGLLSAGGVAAGGVVESGVDAGGMVVVVPGEVD